jgi:hypothetical protein
MHQSFAEYYVADYIISYCFEAEKGIRAEEFSKVLSLLIHIAQSPEKYELLLDFLISYVQDSNAKFDNAMRNAMKKTVLISNDEKLQHKDKTKRFWLNFVAKDAEIKNRLFKQG